MTSSLICKMPDVRQARPNNGNADSRPSRYADDDGAPKAPAPASAPAEPPAAAAATSYSNYDDAQPEGDQNGGYDDHMEYKEEDDDDDDVDFNLGGNASTSNGAAHHQEAATPSFSNTKGPSAKEDG
jgi:hypothetical protein